MATTPAWAAPHNGILGDASAIAGASAVNQMLGTHPDQIIYQGSSILTPFGTGWPNWFLTTAGADLDQPFTMSGTAIGRVAVPVLAFGSGADLLVSLCADNSGSPGAVITQTRVPAAWITQLAAASGVGSVEAVEGGLAVTTQSTGNPLAAGQFNSLHLSNVTGTGWPYPYVTSTAAPSATYYGGNMIQIGGVASGAAINNVFTIPYTATGATGTLSEAIPQASFPTTIDGSNKTCVVIDSVTGSPVVVTAGGSTSFGGVTTGSVYTSTLDTGTGSLSAWSQQTSLPYILQNQGTCSYNGYVYEIAGSVSGTAVTTVSFAQVSNGQITGWTETTPLPVPTVLPFVVAANGFLFVVGGANSALTPYATTWYAPIRANGTLGNWIPGPPIASATYNYNDTCFANANVICVPTNGVGTLSFLGVTPNGPSGMWQSSNFGGWQFTGFQDQGNGQITVFGLNSSSYNVAQLAVTPLISVPLPATGLSNGATYHILLQQQGGNQYNGLATHLDNNVFPGFPTMLYSPRGAYTWTPQASGRAMPIQVYDQTPGGPVWHTWEDSGARITTLVHATTPDQSLLGVCDAVRQSYALNANTGFQMGLSPWQVFGGTAVQSAAKSYEGGFSAQVTPSGSASQVFLDSENLPCMPGQSVTVACWVWVTSAVTSNFSLSVNWYTLAGGLISTSSSSVSVPAGTWTQVTNTFTAPSTGTLPYQFTINPTLGGTPASAQVWYVDTVHAHYTYTGPQVATVTEVVYPAMWPAVSGPSGTLQLA